MANTFVCAMCGGEFEKGWDEAEALAELKEVWGDISPDECDQVCDDCWEKVKPANNQEYFANFQAAQQGVQADGAYCRCGDVGYPDKMNRCVTCGQFKSPRR